ncbi:hypothetical protein F4821DRAFT_235747 [Hypoxylon rubiginosum]|uniref:Uncharacterized protein n=1 Tax=Hypoxylon rubiginosum TaxID=110542 RepID=A0ACC0D5B5_9PEZI|nr:hypothetical protein F4821DRAFT_235747 [Hypoxylon rubiginosum]
MPKPYAFQSARDGLPMFTEPGHGSPPQTVTSRLRKWLHRLWSKLNVPYISKIKSQWQSPKKEPAPEVVPIQRGLPTITIASPENIYNGTMIDQGPRYRQPTIPFVHPHDHDQHRHPGQNGEYIPTISHNRYSRDTLNDSFIPPSPTSIAFRRQGMHLGIRIPEASEFNVSLPSTNVATPSINPETASSIIHPTMLNERERTLNILESRSMPSTYRSPSPASIRRHRRSYQLATDPTIDPQQYSNFLRYLEHEISMDVSLRVRIWKSLIGDSERREGLITQPDYHHGASSQSQPPRLLSPGPSSPNSHQAEEHVSGRWIWTPNDRRARFDEDGRTSLLEQSFRIRQSCRNGNQEGADSVPQSNSPEICSLRRSNATVRHSYVGSSEVREAPADNRRRLSASSLAHSFTQYIKPEVSTTANREPRTPESPESPDLDETASRADAVPESENE